MRLFSSGLAFSLEIVRRVRKSARTKATKLKLLVVDRSSADLRTTTKQDYPSYMVAKCQRIACERYPQYDAWTNDTGMPKDVEIRRIVKIRIIKAVSWGLR